MSVPGIPCIMSSYSLQGEQGVGFNVCTGLSLSRLSTYRNVNKGAVLTHVRTWPSLSRPCTYRAKGKGDICLYLAFPVSCLPMYEKT